MFGISADRIPIVGLQPTRTPLIMIGHDIFFVWIENFFSLFSKTARWLFLLSFFSLNFRAHSRKWINTTDRSVVNGDLHFLFLVVQNKILIA